MCFTVNRLKMLGTLNHLFPADVLITPANLERSLPTRGDLFSRFVVPRSLHISAWQGPGRRRGPGLSPPQSKARAEEPAAGRTPSPKLRGAATVEAGTGDASCDLPGCSPQHGDSIEYPGAGGAVGSRASTALPPGGHEGTCSLHHMGHCVRVTCLRVAGTGSSPVGALLRVGPCVCEMRRRPRPAFSSEGEPCHACPPASHGPSDPAQTVACGCITVGSMFTCLLLVCVPVQSPPPFSHKDTSHWVQGLLNSSTIPP